MYCKHCGASVNEDDTFCSHCGGQLKKAMYAAEADDSTKDWLICLLLCLLIGQLGAHRFYAGKHGTAIIQLITIGGFGIWMLIDLITILMGRFKDDEGRLITPAPRVRGGL